MIVAIDDRSLQQLGQISSWPRSYYARVIDILSQSGARVIVFDILFPDPGQDDKELANSIRNSGNVVLPAAQTPLPPDSAVTPQAYQGQTFSRPLQILEDEAAAVGHANVSPDADGMVRRLRIAIPNGDIYEPALALAAAAVYLRRPEAIESSPENEGLSFAGRFINTDEHHEMIVNYTSHARMTGKVVDFETRSFIDVLNDTVEPACFQDKIVVIGTTASGLSDSFWTPLGRKIYGVELHAKAIENILEGSFLRPAPDAVTIASVILLGLICGLIVSSLGTLTATLLVVVMLIAYLFSAFTLFDSGIILNMFYPPLTIAGTFIVINLHNVITEQSERRQITRIFGRYVSPPVVNKILAASGRNQRKLGGEEQEVTILFADARNFTSIAEKTEPRELVDVLNVYLSIIIEQVLNHDGIINKFGGDSIMAIWNVPVACEKHALLATEAAAAAQRAIRERQRQEPGLLRMEFGIGINTGKALAGNMGSKNRMEYSVIGNTVNLAARITDAAPGGEVWVGENTFDLIKDDATAIPLKPLSIKGKNLPIKVFQIVASPGQRKGMSPRFTEGVRNRFAKFPY